METNRARFIKDEKSLSILRENVLKLFVALLKNYERIFENKRSVNMTGKIRDFALMVLALGLASACMVAVITFNDITPAEKFVLAWLSIILGCAVFGGYRIERSV